MAVFSDRRVQAALEDFVSVAQNCAYTQTYGNDDEHSKFFRSVIRKADMNTRRGITDFSFVGMRRGGFTTQGMYTFSSDGTAYGGMNRQNPQDVLELLAHAKREHDENPPDVPYVRGSFPSVKPAAPQGTLFARSFSRITPLPVGANPRNGYVGRDHLWILRDEIGALVNGDFPDSLAWRIALFQLRDNVRGQPAVWQDTHVQRVNFAAVPKRSEESITVSISGDFFMLAPHGRGTAQEGFPLPETGYEGRIEGLLVYDPSRGQVLDFKMLAEGMHWGRSKHNPDEPSGKFPLKIAFVLVDDYIARNIPPSGAGWGKKYLGPR